MKRPSAGSMQLAYLPPHDALPAMLGGAQPYLQTGA
jgi:hypothetical protein